MNMCLSQGYKGVRAVRACACVRARACVHVAERPVLFRKDTGVSLTACPLSGLVGEVAIVAGGGGTAPAAPLPFP